MSYTISKTISTDFTSLVEPLPEAATLQADINAAISTATLDVVNVDGDGDSCDLIFDVEPSAGDKTTIDNEVAAHTGAPQVPARSDAVLDRDLSAPPGSPAVGDRYLVGADATGAWAGHEDHVAEWGGTTWRFTMPATGTRCWVADEKVHVSYDGAAWVTASSNVAGADLKNVRTGTFGAAPVADGAPGATPTIDWTQGQVQEITLDATVTAITFTPPPGVGNLVLVVKQPGGANHPIQAGAWPAAVKWPGGTAPTITAANGAVDMLEFHYDGTDYLGRFTQDHK